MQLHLRQPHLWESLSESAALELGLNLEKNRLSLYQGLSHALIEVVWGLAKLFPLKKKVYYFKEHSLYFDDAIIQLAKEGYKIVPLDAETLKNPEAWAQKIEREDLFVLYAQDDTLFGKIYDLAKFEDTIKDKNIIKIRLSHALHFQHDLANFFNQSVLMSSKEIDKNTIVVSSLSSHLAFAIMGERVRVGSFVTNHLDYGAKAKNTVDNYFNSARKPMPNLESKARVTAFEQQAPAGGLAFFKSDENRVYDRAVLYWVDMDATALIARVSAELQKTTDSEADFYTKHLQTPNLSRWGSLSLYNYCLSHGLAAEQTRGLLILSSDILQNQKQLVDVMISARSSILNDQFGV